LGDNKDTIYLQGYSSGISEGQKLRRNLGSLGNGRLVSLEVIVVAKLVKKVKGKGFP